MGREQVKPTCGVCFFGAMLLDLLLMYQCVISGLLLLDMVSFFFNQTGFYAKVVQCDSVIDL